MSYMQVYILRCLFVVKLLYALYDGVVGGCAGSKPLRFRSRSCVIFSKFLLVFCCVCRGIIDFYFMAGSLNGLFVCIRNRFFVCLFYYFRHFKKNNNLGPVCWSSRFPVSWLICVIGSFYLFIVMGAVLLLLLLMFKWAIVWFESYISAKPVCQVMGLAGFSCLVRKCSTFPFLNCRQ